MSRITRELCQMLKHRRESYALGTEWGKTVVNAVNLFETGAPYNPYLTNLREAAKARIAKYAANGWDLTHSDILALAFLALADGESDEKIINLLICALHDVNHCKIEEHPVYDWSDWVSWLRSLVKAAKLEEKFPAPEEPVYVPPAPRDPDATTWVEDDYEGSVGYGPSVLN